MHCKHEKALWLTWLTLGGSLLILVVCGAYLWFSKAFLSGIRLNQWAWEASYTERSLSPPPFGPREGYWGLRLGRPQAHPVFMQRTLPTHIPEMVDVREQGLQIYKPVSKAKKNILILGASVAWGAYASSIAHTYFHQLGKSLEEANIPSHISISSDGGWSSEQELAALKEYLSSHPLPDLIVTLNGLNDVYLQKKFRPANLKDSRAIALMEERTAAFLARMQEIVHQTRGASVLFVLQPALFEKKYLSRLEKRLLKLSVPKTWIASFQENYQTIRNGLDALADDQKIFFVDASRCFDSESTTTFSDLWHFSDPGHTLLTRTILPTVIQAIH